MEVIVIRLQHHKQQQQHPKQNQQQKQQEEHVVLHWSRGFQAVEESLHGYNHRDQPPCGELEVPARRYYFSVHARFGCTRSSLFT